MKNLSFIGCSKYSVDVFGNIYSSYSDRFLKPSYDKDGYLKITLSNDLKKSEYWRVHRLVGLCYCDNANNNDIINHKDGNKQNNFYKNLEWCTIKENTVHAYKNGLYINLDGPLSIVDIHKVCKMLEQGMKVKDIANIFNVETKLIAAIRNKERWSSISDEYNINYITQRNRIDITTVKKICEALECGWTLTKISKEYGIGTSTVHRIKNRETYSDISVSYDF